MSAKKLTLYLIVGIVFGECLALVGFFDSQIGSLPKYILSPEPFFAFASLACGFIFVWEQTKSSANRLFIFLAVLIYIILLLRQFWSESTPTFAYIIYPLSAPFIAFVLVLVLGAFKKIELGFRSKQSVYNILILSLFVFTTGYYLRFSSAVLPSTFDLYLHQLSEQVLPSISYGSVHAGKMLPALKNICLLVYVSLPFAVGLLYIANQQINKKDNIISLFVWLGFFGYLIYFIVPACGPIYLFGPEYPDKLPEIGEYLGKTIVSPVPRNAVPSLHTSWALLLCLNCTGLHIVKKSFFYLFAIITWTATMLMGEHYIIDLVIAIPFTICVQVLLTGNIKNKQLYKPTIGICSLILLGWIMIIHIAVNPFQHQILLFIYTIATALIPTMLYYFAQKPLANPYRQTQ